MRTRIKFQVGMLVNLTGHWPLGIWYYPIDSQYPETWLPGQVGMIICDGHTDDANIYRVLINEHVTDIDKYYLSPMENNEVYEV